MRTAELALAAQANLAECPRWDEKEQLLYWIDINRFQLHRFDPKTGEDEFLTFAEEIGCFSLREQGGFVLAMRNGFFIVDGWNTEVTKICDPEEGLDKNRFNDGRCDAKGRFIAGSYYPPKDHDGANLWVLDEKLEARLLFDQMLTSNGAAFSPDNMTFYFSDTPKHQLYKCDYNLETGEATNKSVFHEWPKGNGRPDGGAVDSEGYYWTALFEGSRIARLNPEGEIVEEIAVPAKCPTMVCFGGEDMKTLFITTAGDRPEAELAEFPQSGNLFKIDVEVAGQIEYRFAK